jgi:methionine synthase II (cobalamin-independent)
MARRKQDKVLTAIGSYPKPRYVGEAGFAQLLDKAALAAIGDQDSAGVEVGALIGAGCGFIQFDDPVLLRYPDAAQAWGLQALERCFAGLEDRATFAVHVCCGYPNTGFGFRRDDKQRALGAHSR